MIIADNNFKLTIYFETLDFIIATWKIASAYLSPYLDVSLATIFGILLKLGII